MQFQAKMLKHRSPSISESSKPINLKIQHNDSNIVYSSQIQYDDVTTNPVWQTYTIVKIVVSCISVPHCPINVKFGEMKQNCMLTCVMWTE